MEYLQRILDLQSQVNTYEKSLNEINNENINKIPNFEIIRNNSAKSLTVKNKQNIRAFKKKVLILIIVKVLVIVILIEDK